jgi:hypothetical protein
MEKTNGDDPVTPITGANYRPNTDGLTKREHFAGLAMQGLIAANNWTNISERSVHFADALIFALNKEDE